MVALLPEGAPQSGMRGPPKRGIGDQSGRPVLRPVALRRQLRARLVGIGDGSLERLLQRLGIGEFVPEDDLVARQISLRLRKQRLAALQRQLLRRQPRLQVSHLAQV